MAEEMNIEQIVQEVLDRVLQSSTGVEDMETVTSLTGVKSLPGQKEDKLVNVPFELISKVANDAATRANNAAKEAEESIVGLEDKTQDAIDAAKDANDAAAKAENAAVLVENTTGFALKGTTVRFSGIVENAAIETMSSITPGGQIVYVRALGIFAYFVGGKYYNSWRAPGIPPPSMYADQAGILRDRLYLLGNSIYTATSGILVLLAHRHEILTEEAFEALADKDESTIYMTYEEE